MSANASIQFQPVQEKGWKRGLGNLLEGEYSSWFKSSRWWKHLLLWFAIINLMMVMMLIVSAKDASSGGDAVPILFMYGIFGGMFVAFGVMVIMQRVIVSEKRAGTAAWVLSKPVTRTAFVVSRLVVNTVAILFTSVVLPGVVFYFTLGLFSDLGWLTPLRYAAGLMLVVLHTFFWIALVLLMGTLFESSAGVIAVPIALFFTFWMGTGMIPGMIYFSPLLLVFSPDPDAINALSVSLMTGEPLFSWLPVIATSVLSVIFIAVAIWRFNRQEF